MDQFAELDTADPDISAFRETGGRLIISHGLDDEIIPFGGSLQYYRRVVERLGGFDAVREFARLFLSPGEGHSHVTAAGPGLTLSAGMVALMSWVEKSEPPECISTVAYDRITGEERMTGLVCAYPNTSEMR